jgi:hypothetical protein
MRLADEHVADVLLVVQDVQQHGADGAGARVQFHQLLFEACQILPRPVLIPSTCFGI